MRIAARAAAAVGLLPAGAATALATVALHQRWWGLALGAVATAAALVALPPGAWSRLPFALGWAGLVGWVLTPRPEGDYAISADPQGYSLLGLALLVLVWAVATLPRPERRARPAPRTS
ncbi:hypothetical protein ACFP3Q_07910 [Nocardioides sp. GCM10027113]|uniref:hypothetical protein n=1 Tax=unclassified Nocardioides TaxID=2615069 RepID=UPI0036205183